MYLLSLPLRERGLKFNFNFHSPTVSKSLPLRERGLKFSITLKIDSVPHVAPLAGAWIEIQMYGVEIKLPYVAPLAGAWIEIILTRFCANTNLSLPLRERGLKYVQRGIDLPRLPVAPLAKMQIETV